jgi:hypothetical protein
MGVSATTLSYLSQDALAEVTHDPKEEVPYVAYLKGEPPEREPVYKIIERDEWERRHTAIDVRDRVGERVNKMDESNLIDVSYQDLKESPTGYGVVITYIEERIDDEEIRSPSVSIERLREDIPNEATGKVGKKEYEASRSDIPVIINRETVSTDDININTSHNPCMENDNYWNETPGGTPANINFTFGTFCAPYYSPDEGYGLITSGHVAEGGGGVGSSVHQDTSKVGEVTHFHKGFYRDYAHVDRSLSDLDVAVANIDNSTTDYGIFGIVTNQELQNNVGEKTLYTQGHTTCRDHGTISNVTFGSYAVDINPLDGVEGGDSGGPLFDVRSGVGGFEAYVAGVVKKNLTFGGTRSTTAETVENHFGGHFLALATA